jgi:hypothetical protein
MHLNSSDDEILGLQVVGGAGGLTECMSVSENNLVRLDEVGDEIFGGRSLDRQFLDARTFGERFQASGGEDVQRTQPLSHFVDSFEKFFVLLLERTVKLKEIWAFDVPVSKVRLPHQGIRISQECLQAFDHRVRFLLRRCLCAHNGQLSIMPTHTLRNRTFLALFLAWQRRFAIGPNATSGKTLRSCSFWSRSRACTVANARG